MIQTAIFVFWGVFFCVLTVHRFSVAGQEDVTHRLEKWLATQSRARRTNEVLLTAADTPGVKQLQQNLLFAGLRRGRDLENAILFRRVCLIIPLMLTATLFLFSYPIKHILFFGLIFNTAGVFLPKLLLHFAIVKRRRDIERNLPDALDLLVLCLEAGLSFDSAMVRVAEEEKRVSHHLSRELTQTNHEILAGKPRDQALKALAWRAGVQDLNAIVSAILQSVKLGTSIVKTLQVQADVMRKKRREKIRSAILKTPVKLIFPLLFFIFPTLLIVILGPSLVNIFRHLNSAGV